MKDCNEIVDCTGRREFLVNAAFAAGGLVLSLTSSTFARNLRGEEIVVPVNDKSPLNKVGGSITIDSAAGKVIIVRTGDSTFVAYSATCTHKRGIVDYDAAKKQFVCPKHGSTFDVLTGNPEDGPADEPLPSYKAKVSSDSVTVIVDS